jgi:hypothetical protein
MEAAIDRLERIRFAFNQEVDAVIQELRLEDQRLKNERAALNEQQQQQQQLHHHHHHRIPPHPFHHHDHHAAPIDVSNNMMMPPSSSSTSAITMHGAVVSTANTSTATGSNQLSNLSSVRQNETQPPAATFWITVWPGVERGGGSQRLLVAAFRSMDALLAAAAKATKCAPAQSCLFTPDGRSIYHLEGVRPGRDYVVFPSGCMYREDTLPTLLLEKLAYSVHSPGELREAINERRLFSKSS